MSDLDEMTDAELAEHYNRTRDQSEFEGHELVRPPATPETRNVTLSVRFSAAEISALSERAEAAGMPLTTYIRATALAAAEPPIDRAKVLGLVEQVRDAVRR
jgi:predicted DNA binding CopG/RHH family protein